jgi:magnesium transporter
VLGLILGTLGSLRVALWQRFGWYDYGSYYLLVGVTGLIIYFTIASLLLRGTLQ